MQNVRRSPDLKRRAVKRNMPKLNFRIFRKYSEKQLLGGFFKFMRETSNSNLLTQIRRQ